MHIAIILFFGNLFSSDMLIIIFIGLILFGGEKLPEIARGLGKGIRDFKDASEGVSHKQFSARQIFKIFVKLLSINKIINFLLR